MDLLLADPVRKGTLRPSITPEQAPKLEIKKDPKGLVTVIGATSVPATSAEQTLAVIEQVGMDCMHSCQSCNCLSFLTPSTISTCCHNMFECQRKQQ